MILEKNKLLTQPFLISKALVSTFYYCHSFRSNKLQSWKAVYISRRCQISQKDNNCVNFWCRQSPGKLNHVPNSNKTDSFRILDLFYVKIKFVNERNCSKKRDLWSRYGTKSAAIGCKQTANDDERCQSFGLVFPTFAQINRWYRCHNLPQTTWLYKSTNINANMWLRQRNLSPPLTYFHRSLYVHIKLYATTLQMQPRRYRSIS